MLQVRREAPALKRQQSGTGIDDNTTRKANPTGDRSRVTSLQTPPLQQRRDEMARVGCLEEPVELVEEIGLFLGVCRAVCVLDREERGREVF